MDWRDRITRNPNQFRGKACIRGMRVRVSDVLDLMAAGLSPAEVVEELPYLEVEDVLASLFYASELCQKGPFEVET